MSKARDLANQVSNLISISSGGSNFEEDIVYSSSSPVTASVGTLWVDSSGANPMMKVWDGSSWDSLGSAPVPIITGIAPDNIAGTASTAVIINGTNFESGSIVKLINTSNTELFTLSTTFNNARSLQFLTPALTASAGPYDVKVTNPDNQLSILENALNVGNSPIWQTAFGNIGNIYDESRVGRSFNLVATDIDNQQINYSIISGNIPTNMTMTSGGVISGTPNSVASDTTFSFVVRATDIVGNYADREFNIIIKAPVIQSYTSVGTTSFTIPIGVTNLQVLVVGGGGGTGHSHYHNGGAGGGGIVYSSSYPVVENNSYTIQVGDGGARGITSGDTFDRGGNGGDSIFGLLIAKGGGAGGTWSNAPGVDGGSGGGGAANGNAPSRVRGSSNQQSFANAVSYGNIGGNGNDSGSGGGGGGAGSPGANASGSTSGNGGSGQAFSITGSTIYYGGGGGGSNTTGSGGTGGVGGGGNGSTAQGQDGTNTLGGGAGGFERNYNGPGGKGGSGIVILRY
jgi:hypothetical protein